MVKFTAHIIQRISRALPSLTFGAHVSDLRYDWVQLRKASLNIKDEKTRHDALGKLDAIESDLRTLEEEHLGRISKRGKIYDRVRDGLDGVSKIVAEAGASTRAPMVGFKRRVFMARDAWGIMRIDALGMSEAEGKAALEKLNTVEDDLRSLEKGVGRTERGELAARVEKGLKTIKGEMKGKPKLKPPKAKPPQGRGKGAAPPGPPGVGAPPGPSGAPAAPAGGRGTCPKCKKGTLTSSRRGNRIMWRCDSCDFWMGGTETTPGTRAPGWEELRRRYARPRATHAPPPTFEEQAAIRGRAEEIRRARARREEEARRPKWGPLTAKEMTLVAKAAGPRAVREAQREQLARKAGERIAGARKQVDQGMKNKDPAKLNAAMDIYREVFDDAERRGYADAPVIEDMGRTVRGVAELARRLARENPRQGTAFRRVETRANQLAEEMGGPIVIHGG